MIEVSRFRHITQKMRVPGGFAFFAIYILFAKPTWLLVAAGAAIAAVGILIRAWASGHLRKDAELAMSGPYAYTRNPLYFGSFLIGVGFSICSGQVWLILAAAAFFLIIYIPVMMTESEVLSHLFPEQYRQYSANVPLFFPRLTAYRSAQYGRQFDSKLYLRYREYRAPLGLLAAIALLAVKIYLE